MLFYAVYFPVLNNTARMVDGCYLQGSPLTDANAPRILNLHLEYLSLGARIAPRLPNLGIKKLSYAWFPGECQSGQLIAKELIVRLGLLIFLVGA